MALRCSTPASNKPHPAEKSTPVWLAIWRIWAGFANSQLLPDAAALSSMQGLPRSGNSSAQTSASLHPPAALRLRCLPFTGHGRPRSVRKSSRLRWKCLFMDCICSDRRKSLDPSAPIAYATSVSPPDEAVAWPRCSGVGCWMRLLPGKGAGDGWQIMLLVVRVAVPANHRAL